MGKHVCRNSTTTHSQSLHPTPSKEQTVDDIQATPPHKNEISTLQKSSGKSITSRLDCTVNTEIFALPSFVQRNQLIPLPFPSSSSPFDLSFAL